MKLQALTALALLSTVAACGSSGGSVTPPAKPTPTPAHTAPPTSNPQQYTVRVAFEGGANQSLAQQPLSVRTVDGRRVTSVRTHSLDTTVSTQLPIEISVAGNGDNSYSSMNARNYGQAVVEVSPNPTTEPTVGTTDTGDADLTVAPQPASTVYATPTPPTFAVSSAAQAPSTASVGFSLTGSVIADTNVPLYSNEYQLLSCGNHTQDSAAEDQAGGVSFTAGIPTTAASTASADFYMDGPGCSSIGFVNSGESNITLHFPYGAVVESSLVTPFSELTPAMWSNSITSIDSGTFLTNLTEATPNDELLINTASGQVVKVAFLSGVFEGPDPYSFVCVYFLWTQDGTSQDGF